MITVSLIIVVIVLSARYEIHAGISGTIDAMRGA